jgi:hypothetical protein
MRRLLTATVAAGAAAIALTFVPAAGAAPAGTLTLTGKPSQRTIDVAPKGESVGDRLITSETLRSAGRPVARMEADCVLVDSVYQGAQCTATVIFHDGQLVLGGATLSKPVPHIGGHDNEFAILGGTGRYAGATGTAQLQSTRRQDRLTIRFAA